MQTFTPDLTVRKRILHQLCHAHPQWKARMALAHGLMLLAAGIIGFTAALLVYHATSAFAVFIILCGAACIAFVPYIIALSVKNTAKYKCAFPYTSFANGSLRLTEDGLTYVFWRVGPREPSAYSSRRAVYRDEDKFVYSICKGNIRSIAIEDDVCRIKGNGSVHMPEWAEADETLQETMGVFSFILAFEQENAAEILQAWSK